MITTIVLAIIIFSIYTITKDNAKVPEELAKCIGENSVLYVQTGCPACKTQKELFGSSTKHLQIIDCLTQQQECTNNIITRIPTWIINEQQHVGVQNIETLKSLTSCQ